MSSPATPIDFDGDGIDAINVRRDDGVLIRVSVLKADNGKYHSEIDPAKGTRIRITDEEPTASVEYMPLAKAWAMTVHKSQGLTIDHKTRIFCEDNFRHPAMLYVACSRVKNPKDLYIVGADLMVNGHPWLKWLCNMDKKCTEWL